MTEETNTAKKQSRLIKTKRPKAINIKSSLILIIIVIIVGLLSFWAGYIYREHNNAQTSAAYGGSPTTAYGHSRTMKKNHHPAGTVSAISSSSISINYSNQTTKTFSIDSSTIVKDKKQTVNISTIQNGNQVAVIPSTSISTLAVKIIVNPTTKVVSSKTGSITN
jgi:cytoskeletal protein RodZ